MRRGCEHLPKALPNRLDIVFVEEVTPTSDYHLSKLGRVDITRMYP